MRYKNNCRASQRPQVAYDVWNTQFEVRLGNSNAGNANMLRTMLVEQAIAAAI